MSRTKLSGIRQLQEGQEATGTFRYDEGYELTHPRDLVTKETIDPMQSVLDELAPADADTLTGKALTIYNATTIKFTGYLSTDPTAAYKGGETAGAQVAYIINDAEFSLETPTPATAINGGDKGKLELWLNAAKLGEFDLAANFNVDLKTGNQTYPPANSTNGKLTVVSVGKYNNFSARQKVVARLNFAPSDLRKGYNSVVLKHTGMTGGDQSSSVFDLFYDTSTATPTLTALDAALQTVSPKWLSGVQYAGAGSTILVDAEGTALYDNTYVQDPITLSGFHGAPTATVAPADASVSGLSNPPVVGEVMTVVDKLITLSTANAATKDARITGTPKDPFGTYPTRQSPSNKILVNTFANRDTNTVWHFDDELYRLPLSWDGNDTTTPITGQWNSQMLLGADDAQFGIIGDNENGLLYPAENFTPYLPANTANYAGRTGDKQALRAFIAASSKQSILLTLYGVAAGIGTDLIVEIKLPTQTGWLLCHLPYDSALGVAADGRGCLVGAISYAGGNAAIQTTFGGKNTFAAGGRLLCRITLKNGNRQIKQIGTDW
jgi:hypothetical protein